MASPPRRRIARALEVVALGVTLVAAVGMVLALAMAVRALLPDAAREHRLEVRLWIVRGMLWGIGGAVLAWLVAAVGRWLSRRP